MEKAKKCRIINKMLRLILALSMVIGFTAGKASAETYRSISTVNIAKTISYADVVSSPKRTSYGAGETFNSAGLVVKVYYSDGTSTTVSSGFPKYTIAAADSQVSFRINGCPVSIPIKIIKKTNQADVSRGEIIYSTSSEIHNAFVTGYSGGSFQPSGTLTRAEALTMLCRIVENPPSKIYIFNNNPYSDVTDGQWYCRYVGYLYEYGVLAASEGDEFKPDEIITRAEFAVYVSRFQKYTPSTDQVFDDVPSTHWAAEEINAVYKKGWIAGYSGGKFKPAGFLTRAEAVTIINRMLERKIDAESVVGQNVRLYFDVPVKHWAFYNIIEASTDHTRKMVNGKEIWK